MSKFMAIVALLTYAFSFNSVAAKKECQSYLAKLRNIQAQQRVAHSNKKGRSLAEREQKARDKWWRCQQGKLPKVQRKKGRKSKVKNLSINKAKTPRYFTHRIEKPLTSHLSIKGKYQGQLQQDWLDYYQKPDKCKKVKSTQVFAYCIEDEKRQQQLFEQSLSKSD